MSGNITYLAFWTRYQLNIMLCGLCDPMLLYQYFVLRLNAFMNTYIVSTYPLLLIPIPVGAK